MKLISLDNLPKEPVSHSPEIVKQVYLRNGEISTLTQCSQVVLKPGQVASDHKHESMFEIFIVKSGVGEAKINEQSLKLEEGMCLVVDPGEGHEILNNSNEDLVLNQFGIEVQ